MVVSKADDTVVIVNGGVENASFATHFCLAPFHRQLLIALHGFFSRNCLQKLFLRVGGVVVVVVTGPAVVLHVPQRTGQWIARNARYHDTSNRQKDGGTRQLNP